MFVQGEDILQVRRQFLETRIRVGEGVVGVWDDGERPAGSEEGDKKVVASREDDGVDVR